MTLRAQLSFAFGVAAAIPLVGGALGIYAQRTVLKRYRQFDDLDAALRQNIADRSNVPALPTKKMIGNMNPQFVRNRCLGLQRYLNQVKTEVSREMELDELRNLRQEMQEAQDFSQGFLGKVVA